jgi:hypothetical protein
MNGYASAGKAYPLMPQVEPVLGATDLAKRGRGERQFDRLRCLKNRKEVCAFVPSVRHETKSHLPQTAESLWEKAPVAKLSEKNVKIITGYCMVKHAALPIAHSNSHCIPL